MSEKVIEKIRKDLDDDQRFKEKLEWIKKMVDEYSKALGIAPEDFLLKCEENRNYWSANYYQPAKFPPLEGDNVHVFKTTEDVVEAIDITKGFVCPSCNCVTPDENKCNECGYSLYGLITLAHEVIIVKERVLKGQGIDKIFKPVCWSSDNNEKIYMKKEENK